MGRSLDKQEPAKVFSLELSSGMLLAFWSLILRGSLLFLTLTSSTILSKLFASGMSGVSSIGRNRPYCPISKRTIAFINGRTNAATYWFTRMMSLASSPNSLRLRILKYAIKWDGLAMFGVYRVINVHSWYHSCLKAKSPKPMFFGCLYRRTFGKSNHSYQGIRRTSWKPGTLSHFTTVIKWTGLNTLGYN
jgi:hypothetical protein